MPGETICADYVTEYSTDRIEMHTGAITPGQRVLLVDDLIATGGTLCACGTADFTDKHWVAGCTRGLGAACAAVAWLCLIRAAVQSLSGAGRRRWGLPEVERALFACLN